MDQRNGLRCADRRRRDTARAAEASENTIVPPHEDEVGNALRIVFSPTRCLISVEDVWQVTNSGTTTLLDREREGSAGRKAARPVIEDEPAADSVVVGPPPPNRSVVRCT